MFSRPRDIRGSQNLKVGHVTQATLPCDLILFFWISTSWSPVELQISPSLYLLFWRYCRCKILAFWLENKNSGLLAFLWDLTPKIVINVNYCQHLFHDLLSAPMFHHSVWSVITAHKLTPAKRDVTTVVSDQRSRFTAPSIGDYNTPDTVAKHRRRKVTK